MIKTWNQRMPTMDWQATHEDVMLEQVPCMQAEIDELRAELSALKQQEPIGYAYSHQDYIGSVIGAKGEWAPNEVPLYLAPGAQPVPDMFWNDDDPERPYGGIGEFLNDEICNGSLEVGDIRTVQQAKKLPKVHIRITSINDDECDAEWEVISNEAMLEAAKS